MNYYLNLFTPETWSAFRDNDAHLSGFKLRQSRIARERIRSGGIFLCYLVRLSRWCGALEITSEAFEDETPIFANPDPYVVRFNVRPIVVLPPELAIPIFEPEIWQNLSLTKDYEPGTSSWTGFFRASLGQIPDADGEMLFAALQWQDQDQHEYPFTERDQRQLARKLTVRAHDREVAVEVPDEDEDVEFEAPTTAEPGDTRQSIQMQAKVAQIGVDIGFKVWVPRNDKALVLELVPQEMHPAFLNVLPLNYDDTTLRTIENIDVLWLKGRSMARAFEVEHTTAIYSGLLRMADLLALQPNMYIRLHIVAPEEKRDKVLREIKRPVFSLLERGPLYEKCTYLTYESVVALGETPHLAHMSDSIIEEYEEAAED
jgi:hypothetical protein